LRNFDPGEPVINPTALNPNIKRRPQGVEISSVRFVLTNALRRFRRCEDVPPESGCEWLFKLGMNRGIAVKKRSISFIFTARESLGATRTALPQQDRRSAGYTFTIIPLRVFKMGSQPIRILSVEDHPVFREGLSTIIASQPDMVLAAQATNAVEALAEFRRLRPDVTLMDLRLPGTNGTDALIAIRGEFPQARVVMLTTSDGDGEIQRAMRAGASGYILKSMPKGELLEVIRTVHAGRRYLPPEVAARLSEHWGEDDLTPRELQVLKLIRDGHRNKQIADKLAIAETTVNFHIKNLVDKLQANDRTHAVTIAVRRGLLEV
jgi:DNA-binding NarL/FixJ family response regulator